MTISTKKQLARTLPRVVVGAVKDGQQLSGQEWPCHVVAVDGAIVTVEFDVNVGDSTPPQVICPVAESRYVRLPVQIGDTGYVASASARLGGVTDLGAGLAPLTLPSNLGALVFVPLGRKSWNTIDANAVVIQAPNGSKILTDDGASEIIVDTNQVRITQGDVTVTITGGVVTVTADHVVVNASDSTFSGNLIVDGNVTIDGNTLATGAFGIVGELAVDGGISLVGDMNITGNLIINGKNFTTHDHLPGTYHAGSTAITGNSGGVAP